MSMQDLNTAIDLIPGIPGAGFHGPQPDTLIESAEKVLGLRFPPTYREFLRRLGYGHVPGCDFYGLIHSDFENSALPDAVWITLRDRKSEGLSSSVIYISDTGYGGYYAIDTSQKTPEGESPVVVAWGADDDWFNVGETIAEDFGAFLLEYVRSATKDSDGLGGE